MKISELFESTARDKRVIVDGKEYYAIHIDNWEPSDMKAAAKEAGVGLKGAPLRVQKQMIADTLRTYVIRNYEGHKHYFVTDGWVRTYAKHK